MSGQTVTMPNGLEIEGVPVGTGKAELLDKLLKSNIITQAEFNEWSGKKAPEAPANDTSWLTAGGPTPPMPFDPAEPDSGTPMGTGEALAEYGSRAGNAIANNADIPGGIAGALAGAKAGAPLGPYGIAGGAVTGGAAGTFGGSLLSDWFAGDELDFEDATTDALVSAGFDTATLGAAKAFKVAARAMGFGPDEISKLWAKYSKSDAPAVGTEESLRQTQKMLTDEGGSLTAYQTGKADTAQRLQEGLAEIGVLSGGYYRDQSARNADIIGKKLQTLIDDSVSAVSGDNIGETIHGVVQAGKEAAQKSYNEGIDEIILRSGNISVNPKWVSGTIDKFLKDNRTEFGSKLSDETVRLATEWGDMMRELPTMPMKDLLAFQKKVNTTISQMGDFGMTQNKVASAELAQLSSRIRKTTEAILKNRDPAAFKAYKNTNKAYGEAMEGLVPKLNANVIARADKGDYEAIARVLEGKNPDQIDAFLKSMDTAYDQAHLAGLGDSIPMTKEAAKKAVRGGWLKNIFGEQVSEGFDPKRFARLADYYEKPANARAAQKILGEEWPQFKRLINAMSEMTNQQKGFVGSLVLRSKEAGAVQGFASGGLAATGGVVPAAGILLGPVMLRHITSSPTAVNRLLAGNAKAEVLSQAGKYAAANEVMIATVRSIMDGMSDEQQAEIRNEVR